MNNCGLSNRKILVAGPPWNKSHVAVPGSSSSICKFTEILQWISVQNTTNGSKLYAICNTVWHDVHVPRMIFSNLAKLICTHLNTLFPHSFQSNQLGILHDVRSVYELYCYSILFFAVRAITDPPGLKISPRFYVQKHFLCEN